MQRDEAIISVYGQAGLESNLKRIVLPYPMRLSWSLSTVVNSMSCHRLVADSLLKVFEEIRRKYTEDEIRDLHMDIYGGCYANRKVRKGNGTSKHAWGIAIDLDPARNQLEWGRDRAEFAKPVYKPMIDAFYRHGFINLGVERNYDWMHFEVRLDEPPPPKSPPPPPPPRKPPPPPPKQAGARKPVGSPIQNCPLCACAIKKLEVTCSHGRKPSAAGLLQVVHDRNVTDTLLDYDGTADTRISDDDAKALVKELGGYGKGLLKAQKRAAKSTSVFKFSIVRKTAAGSKGESVTAKVTNNTRGGKKAWCVNTGGTPGEAAWQSGAGGSRDLPARTDGGVFPGKARGTRYVVHGKGCNDVVRTVAVEVFPSQQYEVTIGAGMLGDWADRISGAWTTWGKRIVGGPGNLKLEVDPPVGALTFAWGWEEAADDWRVFYGVKVEGKLDPAIGVKMDLSLSMLACAGMAWGIPPALGKLVGEHLADILVGSEADASVGLSAAVQRQWYTDGAIAHVGEAKVTGKGSIAFYLKATLGSKYIAKAEAKGTARVAIVIEGNLDIEADRIRAYSTGKIPSPELVVMVKATAFVFFSTKREKTWKLWKGDKELWDTRKKAEDAAHGSGTK